MLERQTTNHQGHNEPTSPVLGKDEGKTPPPTGSQPLVGVLAGYLSDCEAAAELGLMARTLRKYRDLGTGPAYVVIGRKVFYPRDALIDWLDSKIVKPVRERRGKRAAA